MNINYKWIKMYITVSVFKYFPLTAHLRVCMCVYEWFPMYSPLGIYLSLVFLESSDPLSPQALLISTNPSCVGGKEAVPTIRTTMVWNIFSCELTLLLTHLSKPAFVIPPSSGVCWELAASLSPWHRVTLLPVVWGRGAQCYRVKTSWPERVALWCRSVV